ncbi:nuclear transport factor 2 family protein [Noviherbaspirillum sp. ST9]|uniref:nuclear transport factor 2 family protein n=1 Tax=Noviherbaspirillum sp. ST9 TaxID=3401606 RepID=UPI003B5877E9
MTTKELCEQYLTALNEGKLERVLALFEPDASVLSPLYGRMPVAPFYAGLFGDTNRSETTFVNMFESASGAVALQFHYRWTLKNGRMVEFDCVDVFSLNADRSRFSSLTIIYDTAPLREDFDAARRQSA